MDLIRLGDITSKITKGTTPTSVGYDFVESGINFVKVESISENGEFIEDKFAHISSECNNKLSRSQLEENDILFSIAGAIGRTALVKKSILPANTNQALAIIRLPDGVIDHSYLIYALKSPALFIQYEKKKQGVAQINLSLQNISDFLIPNLPLDEQRKIAAVLDKVSELIAKRRQQLDKLDEMVKSRFIEMFGDCKQNPKNWSVWDLEDIAQVGSSKRVFVEELKESGISFYRGTEVGALAEGKKVEPELFITEKHYDELCRATGRPKIGDLLMPSICPDGRIWVVDSEKPFYFKDGRVLWVHDINKNVNSTFLLYTLKNRIMADYSSIASGTTFAELKIFSLKKCKIFNVPTELQNQFAAFVEQTEKTKTTISESVEKLETLKKALMQKYFGRRII